MKINFTQGRIIHAPWFTHRASIFHPQPMDTRRPSEYLLPDYGAEKYHSPCGKGKMTQYNIYNRYHRKITETEIMGNPSVLS